MRNLIELSQSNLNWSLDEFVQLTNDLLPQYLPENPANTRVREEVTPRLVRHYTSLEMLDEPIKEGRSARYSYRHLLQMLLVRRLLADGYGASAINQMATSKDNTELEALLQGGVHLTVTPANPALAFLQQLQQRQGDAQPSKAALRSTPRQLNAPAHWTRIEVSPGLELHVQENFTYPSSPQEQQNLLQYINQQLLAISTRRLSR